MNKKELIGLFASGKEKGEASNLYISGNKLINYNTIIAVRISDTAVILNKTKYSPTTSKNQHYIRYLCNVIGEYEHKEFYDKFVYNL